MQKLLHFSAKKLNIAVQIGKKYTIFGTFLLEDTNGVIVEALEKEHLKNAENINIAILRQWLQGKGMKPVTWTTLVAVLRQIGMNELADTIESELY